MKFDVDTIYYSNVMETLQFGNLTRRQLESSVRDGRQVALLLEYFVINLFDGFKQAPSSGLLYDAYFIENGVKKYCEIRVVTKGGTKTVPSSQVGVGRELDEHAHIDKLKNIDYYIFIDIRTCSQTKIYPFISDVDYFKTKASISSNGFDVMVRARKFKNKVFVNPTDTVVEQIDELDELDETEVFIFN